MSATSSVSHEPLPFDSCGRRTDQTTSLSTAAHEQIERGGWDVAAVARNAYDLEGKVIGTLGCGRIGYRVLQRLQPFEPKEMLYYDYAPLPAGMSMITGSLLQF